TCRRPAAIGSLQFARRMIARAWRKYLFDERPAETGHPATKIGRSERAPGWRSPQGARAGRLSDARHSAFVRVCVAAVGRPLEPVALVVVAKGLLGIVDVEKRLAEAEMRVTRSASDIPWRASNASIR